MLPLGPPDKHGSPYKAASAFAAWPGLLAEPSAPVIGRRTRCLPRAKAADWIEDWIAFAGEEALDDQVRFDREWAALRAYAHERGVRLIGDVPIYVAARLRRRTAHPELFQSGAVAGVPPDAFTDDGQLWGNPLYDWPALQRRGYAWWIARFRRMFELFDLVRIDHFRALRRPTGRCPPPPRRPPQGRGSAARAARRSTRALRGARRAAADRRGPRRDHAAGDAAARVARAAGHGGAAVRLHALRAPHPARARVPRARTRSSTPAPTTTTRSAAGTTRSPPAAPALVERAAEPRDRRHEPHWAMIRLAFSSPARRGDDPAPGRARARQRRGG